MVQQYFYKHGLHRKQDVDFVLVILQHPIFDSQSYQEFPNVISELDQIGYSLKRSSDP